MVQRYSVVSLLFILCFFQFAASGVRRPGSNNSPSSAPSAAQWAVYTQLKSHGQQVSVAWSEINATPTFINGTLTQAGYLRQFSSPEAAAIHFLDEYKALFLCSSPSNELRMLTSERDGLGMVHVKFNQVYKGLMVKGSQLIVHFGADGSMSAINGRYVPTPTIDISPVVDEEQAKQTAANACNGAAATSSELIIFLRNDVPTLSYSIKLPTSFAPLQEVIIDAKTGTVLDIDDGIRYDGPVVGTGTSLAGSPRNINVYQATNKFGLSGVQYYMVDATKPMYIGPIDSLKGVIEMYDAKNDTSNPNNPYQSATLVYDPSGDANFTDNLAQRAAVDAHYYTGIVYDYYKSRFNRNSWNNGGANLTNVVHFLHNYNNAFWNGQFMTYGDGDGVTFSNLAGGFDVIAHELTHGVTQATAGLEYRGQSGALNESYSDVFAIMLDSANWLIGEDVYTPGTGGDALRNMLDPHNGGSSSNDPSWQPASMSEYLYLPYISPADNGGVHTNSGIPNRAAYLIANQIGRGKTEQIYYRTLTLYLTNKSLFVDARNATLQSAADLYGSGGTEYNAVASAFDAVGITSNLPRTDEFAYDDGSPFTGVYETDAGWGLANRFTAPGSGKIANIEFYFNGDFNSSGTGSFIIKIFNDNGGSPGPAIFTSSTISINPAVRGWVSLSLLAQDISVGSTFYAGVFYDGTNLPMIGADTVANNHAWEYDATNGIWTLLDGASYFPVTFFIRAIVNTTTDIGDVHENLPVKISLSDAYPNPFNPATQIRYAIPRQQHVRLTIYDALGKTIETLVDKEQTAGTYIIQWNAGNRSSGVYFYRMESGGFAEMKKLILMK